MFHLCSILFEDETDDLKRRIRDEERAGERVKEEPLTCQQVHAMAQ